MQFAGQEWAPSENQRVQALRTNFPTFLSERELKHMGNEQEQGYYGTAPTQHQSQTQTPPPPQNQGQDFGQGTSFAPDLQFDHETGAMPLRSTWPNYNSTPTNATQGIPQPIPQYQLMFPMSDEIRKLCLQVKSTKFSGHPEDYPISILGF
jgi:hypothetical protein